MEVIVIMLCFKWGPGGDMGLNDENWNNVWWTPPESHKAGRCLLGIGITLLGAYPG